MLNFWTISSAMALALAAAGCASNQTGRDSSVAAEARAVGFLQREVPAWSRDNGCFSCHNNGDAARALYAATRKGYHIPQSALVDTTAWLAQPARWDHNKGDPGFSDKRLANLQFAAALAAAIEVRQVKDLHSLREAARKVASDQSSDGAWPIEPQNAVGSPATYGTTLATFMAWKTLCQAGAPGTDEAIRRAEAWLRQAPADNVPAAATLLLVSARVNAQVRSTAASPGPEGVVASASFITNSISKPDQCLNLIRRAQTGVGGWGPYADSPAEPFDTAIVLLALAEYRGAPGVNAMIWRGRAFLAAEQNADGSWPATTRPSGGASYAQRVSTTGWATLALLATRH